MPESNSCPVCGGESSGFDSLAGQCPRCLLALAREAAEPEGPERAVGQHRQFGDYLLVRRLGTGPLGVVHEAHALATGRRLALKRWSAASAPDRGGLAQSAWPASVPDHPGIVPIHARGQRGPALWVDMELMPEGSLRRWIESVTPRKRGNHEWLVRLVAGAAAALDHVHRHGAIHGGIKPENLLFTEDRRRLLLSDFAPANGAAVQAISWLDGPAPALRHPSGERTQEPGVPGDIQALAVCLDEALRLERPVPAAVESVLRAALDADPRRRPATAAELERALLDALGDPPLSRARSFTR